SVVGMEQTAARAMLEARGLVVNIAWENSETVLSGQVIRQSPGANAEVAPGTVVTLTASAGPAPRPTESDPPAPSEEPAPEPSQEAPDASDAP
ncbi:MAG: PASTA domain-containing protein, partial [Oscillospiraceae bacterium]|nr:PASTA domain-containing protein [Oscillospiraceae bacterium]